MRNRTQAFGVTCEAFTRAVAEDSTDATPRSRGRPRKAPADQAEGKGKRKGSKQ